MTLNLLAPSALVDSAEVHIKIAWTGDSSAVNKNISPDPVKNARDIGRQQLWC
jgi:hypothetical protein